MLDTSQLHHWLQTTNRRYAKEGIPHKGRPLHAIGDFAREHNCSIVFGDSVTDQIFDWFRENSPPGAHQASSLYTGIFLYDTAFWPIHVPVIFGRVSIKALDCLGTMPNSVKKSLVSELHELHAFEVHWTNCMDYGYGQMGLGRGPDLRPRASKFLAAGHAELVGANTQLLEQRPNVKAILGMRMATEIFLKAALVQEKDLTDQQLMKISHKLEDAAQACAEATGTPFFAKLAKLVSIYPPVSARYDDPQWSIEAVWKASLMTQAVAANVTRLYSDRNIRSH